MKRGPVLAFVLCVIASLDCGAQWEQMREHVEFLSCAAMEGRKAGSEGEIGSAAYFSEMLEKYGLDLLYPSEGDIFGIKGADTTLVSRNVAGFIPGYDAVLRNQYVLIGARLDNLGTYTVTVDGHPVVRICNGANGNASGLAMALALAERLSADRVILRRSVIVAAFGATLEQNAGAWYFLNRSFVDAANIAAMVNLEMVGTGQSGFYAYTSSNESINKVVEELNGTLQRVKPRLVAYEPVASCHRAFYEKQIPSVMFTTGMYPEYNSDKDVADIIDYADMERELDYVYNLVVALCNADSRPSFLKETPVRRNSADAVSFYDCDRKPSFLGRSDPSAFLKEWVYRYLRYPESAVREGVQGRVLVDFVVDEKGDVCCVSVAKGVDDRLDEEAVRVVSASPRWKPGMVKGEKVRTSMSVYIDFKLTKK